MKHICIIIFWLIAIVIIIPTIFSGLYSNNIYDRNDKKIITDKEEQNPISYDNTIKVYIVNEDKVEDFEIEEYLKGVVSAEMPASFHIEALKAQVVAARTYIYNKMINNSKDEYHKGADVCTNPAHCKAWVSKEEAYAKWSSKEADNYWNKISEAIKYTKDEIIIYNNKPIDAVFHSTCSGKTENSEDVWVYEIPYLRSVESYGDEQSPKFNTNVSYPMNEYKDILLTEFDLKIENNKIGKKILTQGENIKEIFIDGKGIRGTDIREAFNLNSTNFNVQFKDNTVFFDVKGNGHEVGMSQYGANYLANEGRTYKEIIKHYYSNVNIIKK